MGEANPIQRLTQEPVTREGFLEEVGLTQVSKAQWDGNGVGEGPEEGSRAWQCRMR